ncbi:hypothetical protein P3T76_015204 [Phytophthora citrophthora]|uniref:RxLR effector protein n=1 Tax=Phytophthora citrophthora TaxID=4793 RepID=A0AAD9FZR9_9STRA|nr:hypothetical protein P3T76_015204 [Phytophthora citrophthora]
MRFTCVLAAIVAAILHTSVASFSPVQDSKTAPENGAAVTVIDSAESGRLLRRVDDAYDDLNDDLEDLDSGGDDSFGEERGFKDHLKKLKPFTFVKKSSKATKEDQFMDDFMKFSRDQHERKKAFILQEHELERKATEEGRKRWEAARKAANT